MTGPPTLVWMRANLRLDDQPALAAAAARGGAVIPVFIHAQDDAREYPRGSASRWWLHHSLQQLSDNLAACGSRLVIERGDPFSVLERLLDETGADAVYWCRRYTPEGLREDGHVKAALRDAGWEARSFPGNLLVEPWQLKTKQGNPYQVFTPFWKAFDERIEVCQPTAAPTRLTAPESWPEGVDLASLGLLPDIDWASGMREHWSPGTAGADERLDAFLDDAITDYDSARDFPAVAGTSALSPHLHFGEVSVRRIWQRVLERSRRFKGVKTYLSELGWREFAHHILFHFPHTADHPLRDRFEKFTWEQDDAGLRAWQRGRTGYPLVDAGMRQLWQTGWMHNRVRMIVGSFLTKDLLISWKVGAEWFWDTLVDADLANNTLGWQWVSGCGADAAPFFRIFNPVTQSEKFDPDGNYIRQWVPELAELPTRWLHKPFAAPESVLESAGVKLGEDYPEPIVDHADARDRALDRFKRLPKT